MVVRAIRAFIIGVLTAALSIIAGPAEAGAGVTNDADDTSYKNDIRAVYHNDSGSKITYYLQFYNDLDLAQWRCYIGLDFNEDAKPGPHDSLGPQPEEDAQMDITFDGGGEVSMFDRDYERSGAASVSREAVGAPHSASGSTSKNTLKVSTSKGAFVNVGMASNDTGYRYAVGCGATNSPGTWGDYPNYGDRAPDNYESYPIVHRFSGGTTAATPKPRPATAKPASTPAPPSQTFAPAPDTPTPTTSTTSTDEPTGAASLPPTVTLESTEVEPTATVLAFEESSDDGGNLIPVVAGVVVIGGLASAVGLTLLRRRAG